LVVSDPKRANLDAATVAGFGAERAAFDQSGLAGDAAGLTGIRLSDRPPYWVACGRKRA
jgi:hypothetical protein